MITRRSFIQQSGAMMAVAGTGISLSFAPRAHAGAGGSNALVMLFFRGGMDALNFLVPRSGAKRTEYENKRPNIQIPVAKTLNLMGGFGLPDTCTDLKSLYDSGDLAMIHAVGMPEGLGSRSHFESTAMFEQGTPGQSKTATGWLARHLQSSPSLDGNAVIPAMSPGIPTDSLKGEPSVLSIDSTNTGDFHPNNGDYSDEHMAALKKIHTGGGKFDEAMKSTLNNIDILTSLSLEIPDFYPNTSLAFDLGLLAQIIKADLGMSIATVDFGGWDTHENSGTFGTGYYVDRLGEVSAAVGAFFQDLQLAGKKDQVMLASQTDFGRRVRENGNRGTDHGTAQAMMVVGGNVNGGTIYGTFPGITDQQLYLNTDLAMTTDFRQPLTDILNNHLANPYTQTVFPGYESHSDLGLVTHSVAVDTQTIFNSGFE